MSFHVGQKVVCVDDRPGLCSGAKTLRRGQVYIVSAITQPRGLIVQGAPTPNENGWWENRFRPLIERKASTETGMSILRKVADDASKRRNLVVTR